MPDLLEGEPTAVGTAIGSTVGSANVTADLPSQLVAGANHEAVEVGALFALWSHRPIQSLSLIVVLKIHIIRFH